MYPKFDEVCLPASCYRPSPASGNFPLCGTQYESYDEAYACEASRLNMEMDSYTPELAPYAVCQKGGIVPTTLVLAGQANPQASTFMAKYNVAFTKAFGALRL